MNLERLALDMQLKNNKKYTIMVSGASGIVGYGILRSLKYSDCMLIGTTIYDESPADCFADIVEKAPLTKDRNYLSWLIDMINKYHVNMIIPAIEDDMSAWNRNRSEIEKNGTKVLLNNCELIEHCLDKWIFYNRLRKEGFKHYIQTSITADIKQFELPFILKPRCGYGSKGFVKIENQETFEKYKHEIGEALIMQEYIDGDDEEYTISAFFDKNSNRKAYIAMKRKLSKLGFTEIAQVVFLEDILEIIDELANIFKPIGPTNFQFRRHNGHWKLLEINPRISSSTSIRTAFGYNESKMSVECFLEGKDISQPPVRAGKAIRYTEDFILYDDSNYI